MKVGNKKLESLGWSPWATWWYKVRDPTVISFESIPACDGQTDGQTRRAVA